MAGRFPYSQRSKEAPMDFQWTNRTPVKPVWATGAEDLSTPRKRSHDDLIPTTPSLSSTPQPTFGSNQNVPFLFHPTTAPQTPHSHPWAPPPQPSPSKAFPLQNDIKDVDMTEVSPFRNEEKRLQEEQQENEPENERPVATGGMRRVYNKRTKRQESRIVARTRRSDHDDDAGSSCSESDEEGSAKPLTRTTSNHYTLNMPAPAPPQSDLPYVLLGYLQFFFNSTLVLIFLYLIVQFIITVQRDVEHRISEYSQDIIQEISMCTTQYKNNLCAVSPIPAMIQQCANWETCMNRDPSVVGRAKVGAELIAEVVNGFVEPISWKTLIFTLTSLAFLTVFINTLLSLYRAKHQPIPEAQSHRAPAFPIAPATPFPPHHFGGYLSPAPTPTWGRYRSEQDLESPTRKRRLDGGGAAKVK
ncbi:Di-sulfide bridge nucleocytoplasmic transport domain-containing protein [Crassisporium funariophilum]|nr:Di-sulfide bridge nucleocytoplasmic transport domain-containing protein [Crassisporium funariophilum]